VTLSLPPAAPDQISPTIVLKIKAAPDAGADGEFVKTRIAFKAAPMNKVILAGC
jgi:hypothetical protein